MVPKIPAGHKAAAMHCPAMAFDIQVVLELVLLVLDILGRIADLFGLNFGGGK